MDHHTHSERRARVHRRLTHAAREILLKAGHGARWPEALDAGRDCVDRLQSDAVLQDVEHQHGREDDRHSAGRGQGVLGTWRRGFARVPGADGAVLRRPGADLQHGQHRRAGRGLPPPRRSGGLRRAQGEADHRSGPHRPQQPRVRVLSRRRAHPAEAGEEGGHHRRPDLDGRRKDHRQAPRHLRRLLQVHQRPPLRGQFRRGFQ